MSITTTIIDRGWEAFKQRNKDCFVKVGFPEDGTAKAGKGGAATRNMSEVIQIAAVHEFGAPARNVPERSFLRSTLDEQKEALQGIKRAQYLRVVKGETNTEQVLKKIGVWMTARIQEKIRSNIPPALAENTRKAKTAKGRVALIDTAQMINSIQSQVTMGRVEE
jgi:hypothetical protein